MRFIKRKHKLKFTLDPRIKLCVLLLINIIVLASPNMQTELICIGVIVFSILCMGAYKKALRSLLMYVGILSVLYLCKLFPNNVASAFVSMIAVCFRKIAPPLFFTSGMIATTKVGELISAMQKLRIPKSISLH